VNLTEDSLKQKKGRHARWRWVSVSHSLSIHVHFLRAHDQEVLTC